MTGGIGYVAFLTAALIAMPIAVAQTIPLSDQPGRERERFIEEPAAKSKPGSATISLPSTVAPEGAAAIVLVVRDVEVTGSTVYSTAQLARLYGSLIGQTVSLAAVYDLAQRITAKYGGDGFVLSRAIVPPQELDPGGAVIQIRVIEGHVDRVEWQPAELANHPFFPEYAAKIAAERPANIRTIMRYLLLAGDQPGIDVSSRFQASDENTGASTLIVETNEKALDAEARIDNRGTKARGPWEAFASVTANKLLGTPGSFTTAYATTTDSRELQYIDVAYRQVLNSEGLTWFSTVHYSTGKPGTEELEMLDYSSESFASDTGVSYPLIRSRDRNLTLSGLFFLSNDTGDILASPNSKDKLRGLRFKADFDFADRFNAITQITGTASQGIDGLGSTGNDNPLASRAEGRVDFTKVDGMISRVQPLADGLSMRLAAEGQYAFTPLLSPEECGFGGRDFGRAFDPSEFTGDNCWSVSGELRYDLSILNNPFTLTQLYGFVDYGHVYRIKAADSTPKSQDGSSAGVGLRLAWNDRYNTDLSAAKPLSGREDDGWRYFLIASAHY